MLVVICSLFFCTTRERLKYGSAKVHFFVWGFYIVLNLQQNLKRVVIYVCDSDGDVISVIRIKRLSCCYIYIYNDAVTDHTLRFGDDGDACVYAIIFTFFLFF